MNHEDWHIGQCLAAALCRIHGNFPEAAILCEYRTSFPYTKIWKIVKIFIYSVSANLGQSIRLSIYLIQSVAAKIKGKANGTMVKANRQNSGNPQSTANFITSKNRVLDTKNRPSGKL
jgi:hypothetical protein